MESFKDICKNLGILATSFDEESKKFVKKQAKLLKKKTKETAQKRIKRKTGTYLARIKEGKFYKYNDENRCRVFSSAPHAHLIEYGHRMLNKFGEETKLKWVKGKNIFKDTASEFSQEFEENSQKMLEDLFKKNGF